MQARVVEADLDKGAARRHRKDNDAHARHCDQADLDNGPRSTKRERMCVVTRSVRPIDDLIRFVVAPTGEAIPDLKRKLPGRGLWVTASRKAVTEAAKRNLFAKGFKKAVKASPTLADDTDKLMVRGVIEALAITAKAGQVVSGFTKVEDALRRGTVGVLAPRLQRRPRRNPQTGQRCPATRGI
jgi:predicted RNA-binding protein YlxR (DUF448 family)